MGGAGHGQVCEQMILCVVAGFPGIDVRDALKEFVRKALSDMKMMGSRCYDRGTLTVDMHGTDHVHARY